MLVVDAVAKTLASAGLKAVFGLAGSGNILLCNALRDEGIPYFGARHESNAMSMADGFIRAGGGVAAVCVHQGPGFTNLLTHLTEAAKSRIPVVVLAADTPSTTVSSNFKIDQSALAREAGAIVERVRTPATAGMDAARAWWRSQTERRPVVLNIGDDLMTAEGAEVAEVPSPMPAPPAPSKAAIEALVLAVEQAQLPLIVAGRGALESDARAALEELGRIMGAALATTGGAHGLFSDSPRSVGICGGFSSPSGAAVIKQADLVLAFGASLNHWTTHNSMRFSEHARIVQVDLDIEQLGRLRTIDLGVVGDAEHTAVALSAALLDRGFTGRGFSDESLTAAVSSASRRAEPFQDRSTRDEIDPRTATILLDEVLPTERIVATDGGHFLEYPVCYLRVPDARGFVFPQGFQTIGQGLGAAIGAACARQDRTVVAAIGDGGAMMALSDLDTPIRYGLPMVVVIYNDAAYGAEVHHFGPLGHATDLAEFPDTDFAAVAQALGAVGATIRRPDDLVAVSEWLERRDGPIVIDLKMARGVVGEWLAEAFSNH